MAWQDSIQKALDNSAALLAEITESPRPSYSLHGHSVDFVTYQQFLLDSIAKYQRILASASPWEEVGQMI